MLKDVNGFWVKYNEYFYMFFVLSIFGLMSIGQGSDYLIYRIVFPFAVVALAIKFFSTSYTKREWFWMILIGGLLLVNLFRNHEKTLVLTFLAIVGAKNVDLEKVLKWALWERVVLTVLTVALALMGVTQNMYIEGMPKFMDGVWQARNIYCLGYTHPNHAFLDIFTIGVLCIMVYGNKLKWFHYVGLCVLMVFAYQTFICRTGMVSWIACMVIILGYAAACFLSGKKPRIRKTYLYLVSLIPIYIEAFSIWGLWISKDSEQVPGTIAFRLNELFTGRFRSAAQCRDGFFRLLIGHVPRKGVDLGYIHLVYNYGWIIALAFLIGSVVMMWKLIRMEKDYLCIGYAVMCGYIIGETTPLNVGWNITLILLALILFQENKKIER